MKYRRRVSGKTKVYSSSCRISAYGSIGRSAGEKRQSRSCEPLPCLIVAVGDDEVVGTAGLHFDSMRTPAHQPSPRRSTEAALTLARMSRRVNKQLCGEKSEDFLIASFVASGHHN